MPLSICCGGLKFVTKHMDDGEPEDWPESVGTRSLDELLRCPICRGLLRLPMRSHSCAHSFCADCLRRWLAEHAGGPSCCPSCRTKGEAADWTMDGVLRGVVDAFRTARPALLAACTPGPGAAPASVQPPPRPALRSSSRAARAQGPPPVVVLSGSEAEEGEYAEEGEDPGEGSSSDDDAEFAPCKTAPPPPPRRAPATAPAAPAARAPPSGCDLCPLCGKAVPSPLLASHANACLDAASAPAERRQAAAHRPAAAGEKPPQLVMSILTTKALHSYAEQWGLIPPGADGKKAARNRKLLEERWKAFSVQAAVARDAVRCFHWKRIKSPDELTSCCVFNAGGPGRPPGLRGRRAAHAASREESVGGERRRKRGPLLSI